MSELKSNEISKCPECGGDAMERSDFWEATPDNGVEIAVKLHKIDKAISKYYFALDERKHGGVASSNAFSEIQEILGRQWSSGEIKKRIDKFPNLRESYLQD